MEDMKEVQQAFKEAAWTDDKDVVNCRACSKPFSVSRRKVRKGIVLGVIL